MKALSAIVLASVVCGIFVTAACVANPEKEEGSAEKTDAVEQGLSGTTQAQERETTYYSEPEKINEVGFCIGPYRCFGPKGLRCSGVKTPWYDVSWNDCGTP